MNIAYQKDIYEYYGMSGRKKTVDDFILPIKAK